LRHDETVGLVGLALEGRAFLKKHHPGREPGRAIPISSSPLTDDGARAVNVQIRMNLNAPNATLTASTFGRITNAE
jgi:hypothetical protein